MIQAELAQWHNPVTIMTVTSHDQRFLLIEPTGTDFVRRGASDKDLALPVKVR